MGHDFRRSLDEVRTVVQSIDDRLATGNIPTGDIEAIKREVDDLRLRIWASMTAASRPDALAIERYRLRRAAQLCDALRSDIESGKIPATLPEVQQLAAEVQSFLQGIGAGRA